MIKFGMSLLGWDANKKGKIMDNIIDGILEELNRARDLLKCYEGIPAGAFGAMVVRDVIRRAEEIVGNGDPVEMIQIYKELQELE